MSKHIQIEFVFYNSWQNIEVVQFAKALSIVVLDIRLSPIRVKLSDQKVGQICNVVWFPKYKNGKTFFFVNLKTQNFGLSLIEAEN